MVRCDDDVDAVENALLLQPHHQQSKVVVNQLQGSINLHGRKGRGGSGGRERQGEWGVREGRRWMCVFLCSVCVCTCCVYRHISFQVCSA